MPDNADVVVVSGCRTAIGSFGGSLKDCSPAELGTVSLKESLQRSGLAPDAVKHAVFGNVIQTEPRDMYLSRYIAVNAGLPVETPALTLNRLCGSGLQAIISAAQMIMLGDAETAAAASVTRRRLLSMCRRAEACRNTWLKRTSLSAWATLNMTDSRRPSTGPGLGLDINSSG
jgi:acetyl-CoA acetyltransferase